ncbi:hypothetical protein evm_011325 [Chilo suppressalis]|nr:hypothetical protein evm_011325 [Chilo suppressalis]
MRTLEGCIYFLDDRSTLLLVTLIDIWTSHCFQENSIIGKETYEMNLMKYTKTCHHYKDEVCKHARVGSTKTAYNLVILRVCVYAKPIGRPTSRPDALPPTVLPVCSPPPPPPHIVPPLRQPVSPRFVGESSVRFISDLFSNSLRHTSFSAHSKINLQLVPSWIWV